MHAALLDAAFWRAGDTAVLLAAAEKGDVPSLIKLVAAKPNAVYSTTRPEKDTALHVAASKGHASFVQQFLLCIDKNVEIAVSKNLNGHTPLHLAARAGHLEVIDHLIDYSARLKGNASLQGPTMMTSNEGNTPLHEAVLYGQSGVALKLLEINPRCAHALNVKEESPLYIAARGGLLDVVKKIADQGLPTASFSINGTVLHKAVLGGSIRALEILLNRYEELVELTDLSGNNALHCAAQHNNAHMVSILLKKNSTLAYKQNEEKYTPLHMAVYYGSAEAAKELMEQFPAAIEMVDNMGRNAFHIAIINYKMSVLELLLNYKLSEEILNKQDNDGNTPLHHAAKLHQGLSILWLLNDPRIKSFMINREGHTAWAYQISVELMPKALIDAINEGDLPSMSNSFDRYPEIVFSVTPIRGNTVLHLAAAKGDDRFIHQILPHLRRNVGLIISKNIDGDTPLHLAVRAGHLEVVDHLISYVVWARQIEPNLKLKDPLIMQNNEGNTLLHEATIHGMSEVAVSLLNCAKEVTWMAAREFIKDYHEYVDDVVGIDDALLIVRNRDWDTPLHLAAKAGNSTFVDMLIRCAKVMNLELATKYAKGPIIMANKLGNTPLHNAVLHRKSDIALKLLEANPRCGHMLNAETQSPFYIAIRDGLTYVVKKIADQGLYVASMSTHGTILHQSVLGDNIRALEILLSRYEELVMLTDLSGNNALHYAAQHNNARIVSILLNKNSTLAYKKNEEKQTPLHIAASYGSAEAAKELLKRFPDAIEVVDNMGRNALHSAAKNDKVDVLELLLKYVLPEEIVNQQDRDGNTPLHHAAKLLRRQSTLLLLNDRRVKLCLVNQDGDSAFALSCTAGVFEMNFDEMNLWKELKKHESRRCKQQRLTKQQVRPLWYWRRNPYLHWSMTDEAFVATLVSMATFAVTLTVPGGYSQQSGTAIVGHHQAFQIFIVCNTISMCGSILVVLWYICLLKGFIKAKLTMPVLICIKMLIVLSGLMMIMSMLTAVYLTVAPASRLVGNVVVAIGAGTPFLACLIVRKSLTRKSVFTWWIGRKLGPRDRG